MSEDENEMLKNQGHLFTPRFRFVAAMAGWDEEALLLASFVVEDTPDRESKNKSSPRTLTPPPATRKRSSAFTPISRLNLDEEQGKEEVKVKPESTKTDGNDEVPAAPVACCIDRLREELSCAICLEICYEPSTTPCGHTFCKQCLRSAADKCGKRCPKCRQLIANARYCPVNTVLWNTIQLLFPQERKTAVSPDHSTEPERSGGERQTRRRRRSSRPSPNQDEDAALAFRLQREELLEAFRETSHRTPTARANLRGMASRAANIRFLRCQRN